MEKLIELLNEFNKEKGWHPGLLYEGFGVRRGNLNFIFNHTGFPFIEWLVENDKIDLGKIKKLYRKSNEHSTHTYPVMYEYSDLESLLMLLSISDTPIEDLISYLK